MGESASYDQLWLLFSLLCGIGSALMLYFRAKHFTRSWLYVLALLRMISVSMMVYLLLLHSFTTSTLRSVSRSFLVAVDNSRSVFAHSDSIAQYNSWQKLQSGLKTWAQSQNIQLLWHFMHPSSDSTSFTGPTSPISNFLQRTLEMSRSEHIVGTLLVSDGIYTQGPSPTQLPLFSTVHTIGLGDTTIQKDLAIVQFLYNKEAQIGTTISFEALVQQKGYKRQQVEVSLEGLGKRLSQSITLTQTLHRVSFRQSIEEVGAHTFQISVRVLPNESNTTNNRAYALVKAYREKIRVLMASAYPHPDVGALRRALARHSSYEVTSVVGERAEALEQNNRYEVAILYGAFADSNLAFQDLVLSLRKQKTPMWWIFTDRSNWYEEQNTPLPIVRQSEHDKIPVTSVSVFSQAQLADLPRRRSQVYAPLSMPKFKLQYTGLEPLLYSPTEKDETTTPKTLIWALSFPIGTPMAWSVGSNFWKWRLQEGHMYKDTQLFDGLVTRTLQHLTRTSRQGNFTVAPIQENFSATEAPILSTRYKLPRGTSSQTIALRVEDSTGMAKSFSYLYTLQNQLFTLPVLSEGVYKYVASFKEQEQWRRSTGTFHVSDYVAEMKNLTANHSLLSTLAVQTKGLFFPIHKQEEFLHTLSQLSLTAEQTWVDTSRSLLDFPWILALIITSLCLEWGIRKYLGRA